MSNKNQRQNSNTSACQLHRHHGSIQLKIIFSQYQSFAARVSLVDHWSPSSPKDHRSHVLENIHEQLDKYCKLGWYNLWICPVINCRSTLWNQQTTKNSCPVNVTLQANNSYHFRDCSSQHQLQNSLLTSCNLLEQVKQFLSQVRRPMMSLEPKQHCCFGSKAPEKPPRISKQIKTA